MAYSTEYYARWKDIPQGITYRLLIQKLDYTGGSTEITNLSAEPLVTTSRGDKTKLDKVVQGGELIFNFYAVPADNDKYDSIFESNYKDYKIVLQDYTTPATPVNLGTYWLKPDNLTRDFVNNIYEISLSAADGLADLKDLYLGSISDGKYTYLEVLKMALSQTGIELDFKIQLGTYEVTYMASTDCALNKVAVDSRRFYKVKSGEIEYKNCNEILTELLKVFNCTLKQEANYWHIKNPQELNSYVFEYDFATLTQQSRTATSVLVDIGSMDVKRNATLSKIPPINSLKVIHRNRDAGGDLLEGLDDYTAAGGWDVVDLDDDATYEGDNNEIVKVTPTNYSYDFYIKSDPFNASYINGNEYIKIDLEAMLYASSGGYQVPGEVEVTLKLFDSSDNLIATELAVIVSGIYYRQINTPNTNSWKIPSGGVSNYYVEIHFNNVSADTDYFKWKNVHITSVALIEGEATDAVVFDKAYYYKNTNIDYPNNVENETIYGDTEEINHIGGLFIYDSGSWVNTSSWRRYGKTSSDDAPILDQYGKNILNDYQRFKDYIRITINNPTRTITPNTIIKIDSRYYVINKFKKSYLRNFLDLEIVELLITDSSQDDPQEVELTTVDGQETSDNTPEATNPPGSHSELSNLGADDHPQYTQKEESETISGSWNFSTAPTIGGIAISLDGHTHSYDNYNSWQLYVDGVSRNAITTGVGVDIVAGSNIGLDYSATTRPTITISASSGSSYTGAAPIDITGGVVSLLYDTAIFEKNLSDELTIKSGVYAPFSHNHSSYAGISESETISGSWNFTTAPTIGGTAISLDGHTHSYDNYNSWQLYVDGISRNAITTGVGVDIVAGSNIGLDYSATTRPTITISASSGSSYTGTPPITVGGGIVALSYNTAIFELNLSDELTIKSGVYASYSHSHSGYLSTSGGTLSGHLYFNQNVKAHWGDGTNNVTARHDGTYFKWEGAGNDSFYITSGIGDTFLYSARNYLGGNSNTTDNRVRDNKITGTKFNLYGETGNFDTDGKIEALSYQFDTAPNNNQEGNGLTGYFTAGTTVSPGSVCCMNSSGYMVLADANGSGTYPAMAIALETKSSGQTGLFLLMGVYRYDSYSLTRGNPIYLSTSPGVPTTTAPTASGAKVQVLGICIHNDRIYFNPSMDYYTVD